MGDIWGTIRKIFCVRHLLIVPITVRLILKHYLITKINAMNSFEARIYDAENIADLINKEINNLRCTIYDSILQMLYFKSQYSFIFSSLYPTYKGGKELYELFETHILRLVEVVGGIYKSEFAKQVVKEVSRYFDTLFLALIRGCMLSLELLN